MEPGAVRDVLTALLGIATGALSGLFGVGGATISTPGIRLLGTSALVAVGTTLPSIIPGAASGAARYARSGLINWKAVWVTAPFGIVAAVVGSLLSQQVPGDGHPLQLATAVLLGYTAYRMGRRPDRPPDAPPAAESEPIEPGEPSPGRSPDTTGTGRFATVGILAGTLSGLLGIGGGVVVVPGFVQIPGM
ncbi:hypothetical protein BH20ACT2_BH20ACT2_25230 [soil metagenome]